MSVSSSSSRSTLSTVDENMDLSLEPSISLLVRDFGWPATSARYRGDHTPENNPDWAHDPMDCPKAKKVAFQKMETSYALYMANLSGPRAPAQKKKAAWAKFLPWGSKEDAALGAPDIKLYFASTSLTFFAAFGYVFREIPQF